MHCNAYEKGASIPSVCAVELKMDRKRNLCIVWNKKIQQTTKAKVSVAGLKWEPEKEIYSILRYTMHKRK